MRQKKALERLWTDRCDVFVWAEKTDEYGLMGFSEELLLADQPCRLSFGTLQPASGDELPAVSQSVKLFLPAEVSIPAGSKIIVRRGGRTLTFASSGEPAFYRCHQEISLKLWKGWADGQMGEDRFQGAEGAIGAAGQAKQKGF